MTSNATSSVLTVSTPEIVAYLPNGTELTTGLHDGIPMDLYHQLPGVSRSQLWKIHDRSPAHLRYELDHPSDDPSAAMRLGSAVHDCVLLPDLWATAWVRQIEGDGRTTAVKAARAEQAEANPGATILPAADYDTCLAIRDAISRHPRARQLLIGDAEQSALWRDERTGLMCRGRFDLIGHRSGAVVDLKTTVNASPAEFERAIYRYGYFVQGSMYLQGAEACAVDADRFAIIAAEKEPPYELAVYELDELALAEGARELDGLMDQFKWCLEQDDWYGYSRDVMVISLPPWARARIGALV